MITVFRKRRSEGKHRRDDDRWWEPAPRQNHDESQRKLAEELTRAAEGRVLVMWDLGLQQYVAYGWGSSPVYGSHVGELIFGLGEEGMRLHSVWQRVVAEHQ